MRDKEKLTIQTVVRAGSGEVMREYEGIRMPDDLAQSQGKKRKTKHLTWLYIKT